MHTIHQVVLFWEFERRTVNCFTFVIVVLSCANVYITLVQYGSYCDGLVCTSYKELQVFVNRVSDVRIE